MTFILRDAGVSFIGFLLSAQQPPPPHSKLSSRPSPYGEFPNSARLAQYPQLSAQHPRATDDSSARASTGKSLAHGVYALPRDPGSSASGGDFYSTLGHHDVNLLFYILRLAVGKPFGAFVQCTNTFRLSSKLC